MKRRVGWLLILVPLSVSCETETNHHPELRVALDEATLSLRESVAVALTETQGGTAVKGTLLMSAQPAFTVGAFDSTDFKNIRVDGVSGKVLSASPSAATTAPCPGSIALADALAVAEAKAGGEAIAVVPDDDVKCAREIQVLVGDVLWEVKVGKQGEVLETELSDEFSGRED